MENETIGWPGWYHRPAAYATMGQYNGAFRGEHLMGMAIIGVTAGILGLFYAYLGLRVSLMRMRLRISLGDGGNAVLGQAIRAHANFVEYVPFTLVLLLTAAAFQANIALIIAGCLLLLVHRVLHSIGMRPEGAVNRARRIGALLTYLTVMYLSIVCLFYGLWFLGYSG